MSWIEQAIENINKELTHTTKKVKYGSHLDIKYWREQFEKGIIAECAWSEEECARSSSKNIHWSTFSTTDVFEYEEGRVQFRLKDN